MDMTSLSCALIMEQAGYESVDPERKPKFVRYVSTVDSATRSCNPIRFSKEKRLAEADIDAHDAGTSHHNIQHQSVNQPMSINAECNF